MLSARLNKVIRFVAATVLVLGGVGAATAANADADGSTESDDAPYSLSVSNGSATVGQAGQITVTVTAGPGHKCNDKYKNKIKKLKGSDGVQLPGEVVMGVVQGNKIVYVVRATPTIAGAHKVTGQIRFSVCNDNACLIKKLPLDATMTGT